MKNRNTTRGVYQVNTQMDEQTYEKLIFICHYWGKTKTEVVRDMLGALYSTIMTNDLKRITNRASVAKSLEESR